MTTTLSTRASVRSILRGRSYSDVPTIEPAAGNVVQLFEFAPAYTSGAATAGRVDRSAGVIRGVKVIGLTSLHGRDYPLEVLREALPLYEGVVVNIEHDASGRNRKLLDRFGVLKDCRLTESGIFADLHYLKAHPLAETIVEMAESMPERICLSQHASGPVTQRGGRQAVQQIAAVHSVDLVPKGATNRTLFESFDHSAIPQTRESIRSVLRGRSHLLESASREEMERQSAHLHGDVHIPSKLAEEISAEDFLAEVARICGDQSMSAEQRTEKLREFSRIHGEKKKAVPTSLAESIDDRAAIPNTREAIRSALRSRR